MFLVTADAFSGLPNPTWTITDERRVRELMQRFQTNREALAPVRSGYDGLGFRGLIVQLMRETVAREYDLPRDFRIGNGAPDKAASLELADRILAEMPIGERSLTEESDLTEALLMELRAQLQELDRNRPFDDSSAADVLEPDPLVSEQDSELRVCEHWIEPYDGPYWNEADVWANNCYNYAVNRMTNTFAQPGRASGTPGGSSCQGASGGALRDGARRWGNCFPFGTGGLYLMALVSAPGFDYHWYRLTEVVAVEEIQGEPIGGGESPAGGGDEGRAWAHKPGRTSVRYVDNAGRVIRNVERCSRHPYTEFCGYFQAADTMRIR